MLTFPDKLEIEIFRPELEGHACRALSAADSSSLPSLIQKMKTICHKKGGMGLAAPQLGIFIQLAIILPDAHTVEVLINPVVTNLGGRDLLEVESCLSIPPYGQASARIWRSEVVNLQTGTIEAPGAALPRVYRGILARIVQHEVDHLNGVFFINRCQPVGKLVVMRHFTKYLHDVQNGTKNSRILS